MIDLSKLLLLEAHKNVIFDLAGGIDFIEKYWESPDDMWWIEIEQRYKDFRNHNRRNNKVPGSSSFKKWTRVPGSDGKGNGNHVGYVIIRGRTKEEAKKSLLNAVVHLNPWAAQKFGKKIVTSNGYMEAIIDVCNFFFARAYMTINKRSINSVLDRAKSDVKVGLFKGREFHHRAGQPKEGNDGQVDWDKERPILFIDCDIEDEGGRRELDSFLKKNNIDIIRKIESHDGVHYFTTDTRVLNLDFSWLDRKYRVNNRRIDDPMVLVKHDAKMLLYSPCGY